MSQTLRQVGPGRLEIRDGGGCLALFGLPFFAAGIFLGLAAAGIVPFDNQDDVGRTAWVVISFMAVVFAAVGGGLVFGRSWTTIDANDRVVVKQHGLLVPMRSRSRRIDEFSLVALGFKAGDSDSADQFPVRLRSRHASDLELFSSANYAESRAVAVAVARHLNLEFEDATTDHPQRVTAAEADVPLAQRLRLNRAGLPQVPPPAEIRSEITRNASGVTISIPFPRVRAVTLLLALIPAALVLAIANPLRVFFRDSRTPDPIAWLFLGFLGLLFGVLPVTAAVKAWLHSRYARTILDVSAKGIVIRERRLLRTRDAGVIDAADIIDVDFSTGGSTLASARTQAERDLRNAGRTWDPSGPAASWGDKVVAAISRFASGQGIVVKSTAGLQSFGQGLPDDEIHYLHAVVLHALTGEVAQQPARP